MGRYRIRMVLAAFAVLSQLWFAWPVYAYIVTGGTPPNVAPAPGEPYGALSSGLFVFSKSDLSVGGIMPITITRTYRNRDLNPNKNYIVRDFGIGGWLNYDMFLYSSAEVNKKSNPYSNIHIVLPGGSQITCVCSNGNCGSYTTAQLVCGTAQPVGEWIGSVMQYTGASATWDVTRKDGTVFSFGTGAPLQSIRDRYGNSITISRTGGQTGHISQITSSSGRYVAFSYNSSGTIAYVADNSGRYVSYTYNANNALIDVTYSSYNASANTQYIYKNSVSIGNIVEIVLNVSGSGSNVTQNFNYVTYDSLGRVSSLAPNLPQNGYGYDYTMDPSGTYIKQCNVTLPDTATQVFYFDSAGYLTKDVRAPSGLNETTTYTRNGEEMVTQITEPARTTFYNYTSLGDISNVTITPGPGTSSSATTSAVYNGPFDQVSSITDPLNQTTYFYYDSSGNLTSVTDPMNRTEQFTYSSLGQLLTSTDPMQNPATNYSYASPSGDLTSVTDPLGHTTHYGTDSLGRVTSVTGPNGDVTTYAYDAMDHLGQKTDPNGNFTRAAFDLLGEISYAYAPNFSLTTFTRPSTLDKLTVCDALNNCSVTNYDKSGKKTSFVDKRGITTVVSYDGLRRINQANFNSTNKAGYDQRTVTYGYDSSDRVTSVSDTGGGAGGNSASYAYDAVDNVLQESTSYSSGGGGNIYYAYDAGGRLSAMNTLPSGGLGGASYNYGYDADDELTVISGGAAPVSIGYNPDGLQTSLVVGAVTTSYGFDQASRLTSQSYTAGSNALGSLSYGYDADDRPVSESGSLANIMLPGSVPSITYSATDQITKWNNVSASTDAASNLTSDPSNGAALSWDSRNEMSAVQGGPATTFTVNYDARGRRENATGAFTGTTDYLSDNQTVVQSRPVALNPATSYQFFTMPGSGEVLAFSTVSQQNGTATSVPLHDLAGSTLGLVGSDNLLDSQFTYDPAGNVATSGQSSPFPFLYGGMEFDPTGYYHAPSGYYSPTLNRLLSGGATPFSGAGIPGQGGRSLPNRGGGGGEGLSSAEQAAIDTTVIASSVALAIFLGPATSSIDTGEGSFGEGSFPFAPFIKTVTQVLNAIFDIFGLGDLFGGGGSNPPPLPAKAFKPFHAPECDFVGTAPGLCAPLSTPGVVETQFAVGMGGAAGAEAGAETGAVLGSWGGPLVIIGGATVGVGVEEAITVMMAKGGKKRILPTRVADAYEVYRDQEKAAGRNPDPPCKWLSDNRNNIRPDEFIKAGKAWGCRGSAYTKGGKSR